MRNSFKGLCAFALFFVAPGLADAWPKCVADPLPGWSGAGKRPEPEALVSPLLRDADDDELVARLVYAESLASRCLDLYAGEAGLMDSLAEGIARTILNHVRRVESKGKGARSVVFGVRQYRSTFGTCDCAKRKEFLCPDASSALWRAAAQAVARVRAAPDAALKGAEHYFFPRHYDESVNCRRWKGVSPDWLDPKREVRMPKAAPSLEKCSPFYRL